MDDIQVAVCLADVEPRAIRWASKGRLAFGKLHTIESDPGLGKSTLLTDWAARWSRGEALPDGEKPEKRSVLFVSAEDDIADTVRPRFDAAGGDPRYVYFLQEVPYVDDKGETHTRPFELPTDTDLLESLILTLDVGLVVLDPVTAYLKESLSENSNKDVRRALEPLGGVMGRTGAVGIMVRHLNKSGGTNAMYRGGGSIGFVAVARIGLLLEVDPRDPTVKVLARFKGNIGKEPPGLAFRLTDAPDNDTVAVVQWLGESELTARDLLEGKVTSSEVLEEWDAATEWLATFLADGPRPSNDVYETGRRELKLSKEALGKAKTRLHIKHEKEGFGAGSHWVWSLPYRKPQGLVNEEAF